tara:strand:- start:212 stop:1165 length:954 start_codon:yes stop_codon:yes gene_type:complete
MKNKNILIVGANGAMAMETIKHLIKKGYAEITMACRDYNKGLIAKKEILNWVEAQETNLKVIGGFDMNKPQLIRAAVQNIKEKFPFDIVFLAAGFAVFSDDFQAVEWESSRIEKTIFQNLIGSHVTLEALKGAGLVAKEARVVLAGGEGARGIKGMIDKPVFSSFNAFKNYVYLKSDLKYNPLNAIGISKLCGALWVTKVAELERGNMEVIWFSPGLTSGSSGLQVLPRVKRIVFGITFSIMNLLGKSQTPEAGGKKYADCLTGKLGETGSLLGAPAGKSIGKLTDQKPMNSLFINREFIDGFWEIVERTIGKYQTK